VGTGVFYTSDRLKLFRERQEGWKGPKLRGEKSGIGEGDEGQDDKIVRTEKEGGRGAEWGGIGGGIQG
jgi:hypothetical protein